MSNMTFKNLKYVTDKDGEKCSIVFTLNNQEMSVPTNAIGNAHYDEIMKQVDAGDLTIKEAD